MMQSRLQPQPLDASNAENPTTQHQKIAHKDKNERNKTMNAISERLLGHQTLWHGTRPENAIRISNEGFQPAHKSGRHSFRQAVWFYHATPSFKKKSSPGGAQFIAAIDLNSYERVRDYVHEMDNTVVFKVPIPPDSIIAQLDFGQISTNEDLCKALTQQWQCDVISEFCDCCCDVGIPWHRKRSIAEMLWGLSPDRYFESGVLLHLLVSEVPNLSLSEATRLISSLQEKSPRFIGELLRLYHQVFLHPHFARSIMVAAIRYMAPIQILKAAEGSPISQPLSEETTTVTEFVNVVLPQLKSDELIRGVIEMASVKRFPGNDEDLKNIGDWIAERAEDAEEIAFHYIRFSGDTYPTRHSASIARDLAMRILTSTGKDYYNRFAELSDTDYLETLNGIMHAFAYLKESRAVPFLSSRLEDDRKMHRVAAIQALGQIGTPDALQAIRTVANDKRKVVQKAIEQALSDSV